MLNISVLLFDFIVFNTRKGRFHIGNIITTVILQAIMNVGFYYTWSCRYLVDTVNALDDYHILEKAINFTNVRGNNGVLVTIKLEKFRSRYAKYMW